MKNLNVITIGGFKVTDSKYTLVESVDYKIENRTNEDGEQETYVVGIGNYTDEKRIKTSDDSSGSNLFVNLFALIEKLLSMLFGIF